MLQLSLTEIANFIINPSLENDLERNHEAATHKSQKKQNEKQPGHKGVHRVHRSKKGGLTRAAIKTVINGTWMYFW